MLTLLHVSDLHFGVHSVPAQVAAVERRITGGGYDVVVVSGDLTQRARAREFARARAFLELAAAHSRVLAVPGNHDVTWWRAPMHLAPAGWMYAKWRRYLGRETEPVVRVPGATLVGLNTAHGISRFTLTSRLRDLSVIGDLRDAQIARAAREFAQSPAGDRRVIVMHHNPVAGDLSRRYGLKHWAHVLDRCAALGVSVILCGHDHQEKVHHVAGARGGIVVSTAGTTSTRSRGGCPGSVNELRLESGAVAARALVWNAARGDLVPGEERRFAA